MPELPPNQSLDRLRGWSLTALYAAMALFSLILLYSVYLLRAEFEADTVGFWGAITSCVASTLYSSGAAYRFFLTLKQTGTPPNLALLPFLFMALALAIPGKLMTGL